MTGAIPNLWSPTPLIYSSHLSRRIEDFYTDHNDWKHKKMSVYLKLELLHPPHSFKHRGISLFAYRALEKYGKGLHLVIASGGNAGYAAACAAKNLGVKCSVCLPNGAAPSTIKVLEEQDAQVVIVGRFYAEALEKAKEIADQEEKAVFVPAYDDHTLWEGHGSMIEEVAEQLPSGKKPTGIFCSVGGGGLLGGIMEGCRKVGWEDVSITALETIGSNCFHHSVLLNTPSASSKFAKELPPYIERLSVSLQDDSSSSPVDLTVAKFTSFHSLASGSLGASTPSSRVLQTALTRRGTVNSISAEDEVAVIAALGLVDDHKLFVELSCAITLVPAYFPELIEKLDFGKDDDEVVLVFIVCGGFKVSSSDIPVWKKFIGESKEKQGWKGWKVVVGDGDETFVREEY